MLVKIGKLKSNKMVIDVPSSKSLSHRALIASSLCDTAVKLYHLADNDDTNRTMQALEHFGASFEKEDNLVCTSPLTHIYDKQPIDCFASGSTLRFLIPLLSQSNKVLFTGTDRLMERPLTIYEEIYHKQGLTFEKVEDGWCIEGPLQPGHYRIPGNISSQFITGLLFLLPLLNGDSTIEIVEPYESKSYADLTIDVLKQFSIQIEEKENGLSIPGNQTYRAKSYTVEADASQAAFFIALSYIAGVEVVIENMAHDSKQGDAIMLDLIQQMGGHIEQEEKGYHIYPSALHGVEIDLADCPDLGPILFALATIVEGETIFKHTERLRIKESDRVEAMKEELEKLGCEVIVEGDIVRIPKASMHEKEVILEAHDDHRIAMALSILALCRPNTVWINQAESVKKSYPKFYEDLEKIGVDITYD